MNEPRLTDVSRAGMARVFAAILDAGKLVECRGTQLINEKNLSGYRNKVNEQVQCRDANLIGTRNLSG